MRIDLGDAIALFFLAAGVVYVMYPTFQSCVAF